jgi:murein peptide amidase A
MVLQRSNGVKMIRVFSGWKATQFGSPIDLVSNYFDPQSHAGSNSLPNVNPILLIGGVHGDEPEGVRLANSLVDAIKSNPNDVQRPFLIIPNLNPDGFKNEQRTNGNGVDLNRNFPCKNWSAKFEKERYFPGSGPASELETKAVVELVHQTRPELIIHFHSWKPMVVLTADRSLYEADLLAKFSGYKLKNSIGYPTPGSLGDWGWEECKIPVICTEESEGTSQEKTWKRFGPALLQILGHRS